MKRILHYIKDKSQQFSKEPMFEYLNDSDIPAEQKICFAPMMGHFVFSFMDMNKYILRKEASTDINQRLVNIHSMEDANHWPWWEVDMNNLGLNKTCSYVDALKFAWSDATIQSRMLTYEFIAVTTNASSRVRLAIVETVEMTGYSFLGKTAEICAAGLDPKRFPYYGPHHSAVESGHHMGTEGAESYLESVEFTDAEFDECVKIVDKLFAAYAGMLDDFHTWVTTHDIEELRAQPFYTESIRDRGGRKASMPLNQDELQRHGSPVKNPGKSGVNFPNLGRAAVTG